MSKPAEEMEPPKYIGKLTDVPPGHVVIDDESLSMIRGNLLESVLVYAPTFYGPHAKNRPVWVLGTEHFFSKQSMVWFELRKKLNLGNALNVKGAVTVEKEIIKALRENSQDAAKNDASDVAERSELHEYYEEMVLYALREGVSDIHIEKRNTRSRVRMRKHGQMIGYHKEVSNQFCDRLCRMLYNTIAENKDVQFREDLYQACAINLVMDGIDVKLRYQSLPAYPGGFDVVLRVLPVGTDDQQIVPLQKLGYTDQQVEMLEEATSKPVGACIIAGTTGSGKSTTLKNLLMGINAARHYRCKIFTIEDPPEYKIPHVTQCPVVRRDGDDPNVSPFLAPLTAAMRGDPDILMIGEVRDKFTGDGLKKGTQSGHQVLTTVHATSALGIIDRLEDFGITKGVMGSPEFLNGLIYQKLVPTVCPECSVPFSEHILSASATKKDMALARRLERICDLNRHIIKVRGPGCTRCKGMGIAGRTVCAEIVAPDFVMLKFFQEQESVRAKHHWRSLSDRDPDSDDMTGKTVLEHALVKMRRGLCDPNDVEEVLGPVDGALRAWEQMVKEFGDPGNNRGKGEDEESASH